MFHKCLTRVDTDEPEEEQPEEQQLNIWGTAEFASARVHEEKGPRLPVAITMERTTRPSNLSWGRASASRTSYDDLTTTAWPASASSKSVFT